MASKRNSKKLGRVLSITFWVALAAVFIYLFSIAWEIGERQFRMGF